MRKHLVLTTALAAVIALTVAGVAMAAKDTVVRAGNLIVTIDGSSGVTPKALSKKQAHPDRLHRGRQASAPPTAPSRRRSRKSSLERQERRGRRQGLPDLQRPELQARDTTAVEEGVPEGDHRQGQDEGLGCVPRTGADPGHQSAAGLQRRRQGRHDHVLHPRLPDPADRHGDRHHGENQEAR